MFTRNSKDDAPAQTRDSLKPAEREAPSDWREALEDSDRSAPRFAPPSGRAALEIAGLQLTLGELFFITTLSAIAFWIYHWVSPILATICGCLLIFVAIMRAVGRRPAFVGGIIGFGLAGTIGMVSCIMAKADLMAASFAVIGIASVGYFLGAIMTELAEDDSL